MKVGTLFRSVAIAFCLIAKGIAVLAVLYGVLYLLFWSIPVVSTIFALLWAGQSYLIYQHELILNGRTEHACSFAIKESDEEKD